MIRVELNGQRAWVESYNSATDRYLVRTEQMLAGDVPLAIRRGSLAAADGTAGSGCDDGGTSAGHSSEPAPTEPRRMPLNALPACLARNIQAVEDDFRRHMGRVIVEFAAPEEVCRRYDTDYLVFYPLPDARAVGSWGAYVVRVTALIEAMAGSGYGGPWHVEQHIGATLAAPEWVREWLGVRRELLDALRNMLEEANRVRQAGRATVVTRFSTSGAIKSLVVRRMFLRYDVPYTYLMLIRFRTATNNLLLRIYLNRLAGDRKSVV